jgi:hypothetical protein
MIKLRGGPKRIDSTPSIKALMAQSNDLGYSFLADFSIPLNPSFMTSFDPITDHALLFSLPPGLRQLAQHGYISTRSCEIAQRLYKFTAKGGYSTIDLTDTSQYKYFSHNEACPSLTNPDAPLFDKIVTIAMLRYAAAAAPASRTSKRSVLLRERFTHDLSRITRDTYMSFPKMIQHTLLWIWYVTIDHWAMLSRTTLLEPTGIDLLKMVTDRFPEVQTWTVDDFEQFLSSNFLWRAGSRKWLLTYWNKYVRQYKDLSSASSSQKSGLQATQSTTDRCARPTDVELFFHTDLDEPSRLATILPSPTPPAEPKPIKMYSYFKDKSQDHLVRVRQRNLDPGPQMKKQWNKARTDLSPFNKLRLCCDWPSEDDHGRSDHEYGVQCVEYATEKMRVLAD